MYRAVLLAFLVSFFPGSAQAQFTGVEPLTLSITPSYPAPYETITVSVKSTVIDLASGITRISVNGTVVGELTGSGSVPVTVGGPGQATRISAVTTIAGTAYTKEITVRPAAVSLVLEPTTTSHPFYQGGKLVAPESRVRLVAMPDFYTSTGARIAPSSLVYTWKFGDRALQDQSGIGRSILSATAPLRYRDAVVSVTVTNQENTAAAQATVVVAPTDPLVRVYRTDPLLGPLFNRALGGAYAMQADEESFRAVPYFFGSTPSLTWLVNSQVGGTARDLTVRSTGAGEGTAALSLTAKDAERLQSASTNFSVEFGKSTSGGLFGL